MSEWSRPPRVILADDYEGVRRALTRLLTPACDVVGDVGDHGSLFHAIERLRPDIVILDVNMPGIEGLDACRRIKAATPGLDVILCAVANDSSLRAGALAAGA